MHRIEFLFDFASPNAYLVHRVLPAFMARTGATVDYRPVLLGGVFKATNNQAPMVAFAQVRGKMAYERLEMTRFIERHRIPFEMNPSFPVNTLHLMRGAILADNRGDLPRYVELMMHHMWQEPKKLDDPGVIAQVLSLGGYDATEFMASAQDQAVKDRLAANTADAVARGVFGLPSFFVGEQMWFGKERLDDIAAWLARDQ